MSAFGLLTLAPDECFLNVLFHGLQLVANRADTT